MVVCKKCGNKAPSSSMKLDIDEGLVICTECLKNKAVKREIKETVFHKKEPEIRDFDSGGNGAKPEKIRHQCSSCGFKFRLNAETKTPKNCPYCNARVYFNFL